MPRPSAKPPGSPEPPGLVPGSRVGRYTVVEILGTGGMGEVYLARDGLIPRQVALKRAGARFAHDRSHDRILKEAQRAGRLAHGRIATIYDVVEEAGTQFLVMEYVPGCPLRQLMSEPMAVDAFWPLANQLVEALAAAHREGLVHRDIKPENIIITPSGQVKLVDFGIAGRPSPAPARTDAPTEAARETTVSTEADTDAGGAGTPAYMAPEVLLGGTVDARSDLFSLGVVFYEMLAGSRPFPGDTTASVVARILQTDPEPLLSIRPELPPSLAGVVHRLLARDPAGRYASASRLGDDLAGAHRGELSVRTLRVPVVRPPRMRARTWFAALLVASLGTGAVLIAADADVRLAARRAVGLNVLPGQREVAVLPIAAGGTDPELASLGAGLTKFLTEALTLRSEGTRYRVSPGDLARDQDVRDPAQALSRLGATLALAVRLIPRGNELEVSSRLVDTESQRTLATSRTRVPAADVFRLARTVTAQALRLIGEGQAADELDLDFATHAPAAFRSFLVGQGELRAAKTEAEARQAIHTLERAASVDPRYGAALIGLAEAHLRTHELGAGKEEETAARAAARRAVAVDDSSMHAHLVLGLACSVEGDLERAEAEYRLASEVAPERPEPYFYLGSFYSWHRRYEEAAETYGKAVYRVPGSWQVCWWLGSLLFRMGRYDEAGDAFRELTRRSPRNHRGYANLGGILVLQGRYPEGIEALERANELQPGVVAWSNLGTAWFNLRRFDEAIAAYQTALQFEYQDPEVWANLGDAYWWAPGRRGLALDAYREAEKAALGRLDRPTTQPGADALLADIYPKLGLADSARVHLRNALEVAPGDVNVLYRAALSYWQLGDSTAALDCLERSVSGGYPLPWIRDSAVFDAWRDAPRFKALVDVTAGRVEDRPGTLYGG